MSLSCHVSNAITHINSLQHKTLFNQKKSRKDFHPSDFFGLTHNVIYEYPNNDSGLSSKPATSHLAANVIIQNETLIFKRKQGPGSKDYPMPDDFSISNAITHSNSLQYKTLFYRSKTSLSAFGGDL